MSEVIHVSLRQRVHWLLVGLGSDVSELGVYFVGIAILKVEHSGLSSSHNMRRMHVAAGWQIYQL